MCIMLQEDVIHVAWVGPSHRFHEQVFGRLDLCAVIFFPIIVHLVLICYKYGVSGAQSTRIAMALTDVVTQLRQGVLA